MFKVIILTVMPELMPNDFDTLLSLVSPEKQKRIKQFHSFRDAQNCLLGDILARIEICHATGLGKKQLEFSSNAYGKPFLVNNTHIHFNISHTDGYVVCAVADQSVGVDIELMKSVDMKIAKRFFMPDETAYIMAGDNICRFYEVWTKKESRMKWEGKGLYKPLTSFSVLALNHYERIYYHEAFKNEKVICHVCSKEQEPPTIRRVDTDSIMRNIMSLCRTKGRGT